MCGQEIGMNELKQIVDAQMEELSPLVIDACIPSVSPLLLKTIKSCIELAVLGAVNATLRENNESR